MESTTLVCKRCEAPLEYEEGSSVLRCSHCGYTEVINESDRIKIERIQAKAYKDTRLGMKKLEMEAAVETSQVHLEERKLALKRIILIAALVAIACIIVLILVSRIKRSSMSFARVPLSAEEYCGRDYQETHRLLQDTGFDDIQDIPSKTLSKGEQQNAGTVVQVSINGNTSFLANTRFSKSSIVKIVYLALDPDKADDIRNPLSFLQADYKDVVREFRQAGFSNIFLKPLYDIKLLGGAKADTVESVTTVGNEAVTEGDWVSADTPVIIAFHTKEFSYIDANYSEVEQAIKEMGFTDITLVPLKDTTSQEAKKENCVESVTLLGTSIFDLQELDLSSPVVIRYHSPVEAASNQITMTVDAKDLTGQEYSSVIKQLETLGFADITEEPLKDIGDAWYNPTSWIFEDGAVSQITIDGESKFHAGDIFDRNAAVVVTYHSKK